jgi:glycine amidinotransferase
MFSVHQHWDPLKVCVVGASYPPKFYDYIKNKKIRKVFYRIAEETEEDYQQLISLLTFFGVEVIRPTIEDDFSNYWNGKSYLAPPMTPRDFTAMIGNIWFTSQNPNTQERWNCIRGSDWPINMPTNANEFKHLPKFVIDELENYNFFQTFSGITSNINLFVEKQGNPIVVNFNDFNVNAAMCTRVGKDLYFGTENANDNVELIKNTASSLFPNYRCHVVDTQGHSDGTFCPVVPGLIVSLFDMPSYEDTFPGWEVVYCEGESWFKVSNFLDLKKKNKGKWWVPGEELNDEFTDYVETWMNHWVGYVEETVFDVNMLVIDQKNVVCNNYNKKVFDAFSRFGITPHVINFRHRYFWDGGLHCITSDLHREGTMQDYFPERG